MGIYFFASWEIFHAFFCMPIFFKINFFEKMFKIILVSNSLVPDQARYFVGPNLDPSCLQKLSTDDNRNKGVKGGFCAYI